MIWMGPRTAQVFGIIALPLALADRQWLAALGAIVAILWGTAALRRRRKYRYDTPAERQRILDELTRKSHPKLGSVALPVESSSQPFPSSSIVPTKPISAVVRSPKPSPERGAPKVKRTCSVCRGTGLARGGNELCPGCKGRGQVLGDVR